MTLLQSILDNAVTVALVLVMLVALVVIHEFGHLVAAKRAGVRVHEFGIGFPPRALILHRGPETIYSLNWLPIGGFVRLEGEDGDSDDPRSFVRQSLGRRIVILLAGVAMNLLLAWVIFTLIAGFADPSMAIRIGYVFPGSPAASAGLVGSRDAPTPADGTAAAPDVRTGDVILGFDGKLFSYFDALQNDPLGYPRQHAGQRIVVDVRHADGTVAHIPVTLRSATDANGQSQPVLGIEARTRIPGATVPRSPLDAVAVGTQRTVEAATLILGALRDLVGNLAQPTVSGPIGIVRTVGAVRTEAPPVFLLYLVGLLSANLAIVNALPIPPMDGGRVVMGVIKSLSRGRLTVQLEQATYLVGFMLLIAFLLWVSWFDIQRPAG